MPGLGTAAFVALVPVPGATAVIVPAGMLNPVQSPNAMVCAAALASV